MLTFLPSYIFDVIYQSSIFLYVSKFVYQTSPVEYVIKNNVNTYITITKKTNKFFDKLLPT